MDLSILLISYNTKKLTLQALESIFLSLKDSSIKFEVLVLDNNSSDGSPKAIETQFKSRVKLFSKKENLGFGRGNNFLAERARGKYLLLLNSDIYVQGPAIPKLFTYFCSQSRFAFVGAKLLNTDLSPQASVGPLYNPFVAFVALFLRGDYWGATRSSPSSVQAVGWVSGACFMTTKENYHKVGGFDENIFMYMEEIDLFKRAAQKKLRVGFYPEAIFIHHGFASSGNRSRPVVNVFKGYLYYYGKHYGPLANSYLRLLLKTKAWTGYTLGKLLKNSYLQNTYDEALKIVRAVV